MPVPTIKYYVREGLLPAGRLTSPNQASYDATHERRLRLIRVLLDVGGLKLAAIADVLTAVDDSGKSVHSVLGVAANLIVPRDGQDEVKAERGAARARAQELITRRGWLVDDDGPAAEALATALAALERVGHGDFAQVLDTYADAAEKVARADLAYVAGRAGLDDLVESVVVGTVLGDALFAALRRLAQADSSVWIYENTKEGSAEDEHATGGRAGSVAGNGKVPG